MKDKRITIDLQLSICTADADNPKVTAALHAMLGALAPLMKTKDLEDLQEAVDQTLIAKKIEAPQRRKTKREDTNK